MKRKQVYFSLFVIVSTALLIYSVVDRYNKDLPKELMDYSWQLSMLLDYPFLLFFFGFLPVSFFMVEQYFRGKEGKSFSIFFRVRGRLYKVGLPFGLLVFALLFLFLFDSCANEKIVFSWDQVLYIGLAFLLHFGFCYWLWFFLFLKSEVKFLLMRRM